MRNALRLSHLLGLTALALGGACAPAGRAALAPTPQNARGNARPAPRSPAAAAASVSPVTARAEDTLPAVAPNEVAEEAVRLFGERPGVTFDIDVTSYAANRRVREYLDFFQVDARARFDIWLARLGRYEGMIRERLRLQGLPEDLVYLTLIESGLSNTAVSHAQAVGMWQFMASTGRVYGLEITPWVDERRDPFKATDAAARHLADLVEDLGSVYLAAAAYNAGMGRVKRSLVRLPGEPDSLTDQTFFQLAETRYLKRETRDYVPKLIAAALVAKQPERYGFVVRPLPPLMFDELVVPDATGLDVVARLSDTTIASILELNPQYVRGVTPPGRASVVRVPRGRGETAAVAYANMPVTDRVTAVAHYVSRGETLSGIARTYRVSVAMIHGANPTLKPRSLRVGQRIVIPLSGRVVPASAWSAAARAPAVRAASSSTRVSSGRRTSYRVRAGVTLSSIARNNGVSLTALLEHNDLERTDVIKPGQVVRIPAR